MCSSKKTKRKRYGFLYKNNENSFVYGCSRCCLEFSVGTELEQHTNVHDVKREPENVASELVLASESDIKPFLLCETEFFDDPPVEDDVKSESKLKMEQTILLNEIKPVLSPDENAKIEENDFGVFNDLHENFETDDEHPDGKDKESKKKKKNKKSNGPKLPKIPEFICDICSRGFTSVARVLQHMKCVHIMKERPVKPPLTPTMCTICGKNVRDMKSHYKLCHTDERPFNCDYCNMTFKQKSHRDNHLRQHTGEKPFICFKCGKSYCSQSAMNGHIKRYHYRLKPHKCEQCNRSYRDLYELRDHINLHHLNKKLHICSVCSRGFGTRKHMHQHMLSHGEKRFQCKFCDQKFATTSGRRGHEIRTHGAI